MYSVVVCVFISVWGCIHESYYSSSGGPMQCVIYNVVCLYICKYCRDMCVRIIVCVLCIAFLCD